MTIGAAIDGLARDESGKGVIKFTLGCCLLGLAVASSSPAFEANPLLSGKIHEMRKQLPETLEKVTKAMGG